MPTDAAPPIDEETKARLAGASVATLTTQLFKRGLRNLFLSGVGPLNPAAARFVGQPSLCATSPRARTSTGSRPSRTPTTPSAGPSRPCRRARCW